MTGQLNSTRPLLDFVKSTGWDSLKGVSSFGSVQRLAPVRARVSLRYALNCYFQIEFLRLNFHVSLSISRECQFCSVD